MSYIKYLLIFTFCFQTFANLIDYSIATEGSKAQIILSFDKKVSSNEIGLDFINQTIQFEFKGHSSFVDKKSYNIDKEKIKSIYFYQPELGTTRVRVILNKPLLAENFKNGVRVENQGRQVILTTLINNLLPSKDNNLNLKTFVKEEKKTLNDENPIASQILTNEISDKIKKQKEPIVEFEDLPAFKQEQVTKVNTTSESLWSRLFLSLFLVIALSLGFLYFAKWWSKRNQSNEINTQMKIMTQFHLGPKKSVIIIRVAGEFLLLGVTDHSINLIKTLSLIDDEFEENSSNFDHLISDETSEKVSFYKDKVSLNNKKTKQDEDLLLEIKNLVTDKLKDLKKLN